MVFGAIGDVRGNLGALQAVLQALSDEGIQSIVNTGDSAVGGDRPTEVVEALRSAGVVSVQGDRDRLLVRFLRKGASMRERLPQRDFEALERAFELCGSTQAEYLRSLPHSLTVTVDGISVAVCHGSLTSQAERLGAHGPEELFRRQRELTPASIVVCGHGEEAFVRQVEDTLFVNPGSVGMAEDGLAHFAVVSTETEPWGADRIGD